MADLLLGFGRQKTQGAFSSLLSTMCKRMWPLVLFLTFLFLCELFLPVKGWTQAFTDVGTFYFTGSQTPRRVPIFREWMTQYGATGEGLTGGGLKVGPVSLHPFLGVAESYTDNVFRRDTNRRTDFLTVIAPGLQALLPFGADKHSLLLDYRAGQFLYKNFTENNALAQDATAHLSLNFPSGLKFHLQGVHLEAFDPRGSELDTQQQDITKWNTNELLNSISYLGPRAGVSLTTSLIDLHYKNNGQAPLRDRTRIRSRLALLQM